MPTIGYTGNSTSLTDVTRGCLPAAQSRAPETDVVGPYLPLADGGVRRDST
jgi:hypothetical protein